jgi:DEAD/DEAH box helicase domain-containing protein
MLHEQAIYQHDGEQYQVERLDWENHKAFVTKVAPDYFTTALSNRKVSVIEETAREKLGRAESAWGEVSVVEKVVGYKKIKFHTHDNVGYGDVRLPEMQMHTTALWLTVPEDRVRGLMQAHEPPLPRPAVIDAIRGLGQALHTVASVGLMIDPRDLGRTIGSRHASDPGSPPNKGAGGADLFDPTVFLYDQVPGGVGLAPRLYEQREELVRRARRLMDGCACEDGCPACIGPPVGAVPGAPGATPLPSLRGRKALGLELLTTLGVGPVQ